MSERAYYNEHDAFAAAWLRELIARGLIAPGEVDARSIVDVRPDDLRGFTQCHFFAGIGVWSHALRGAGWRDDRAVWTGSCPCQPFSNAGKRTGLADDRHLWPIWFDLIRECRPRVIIGEQVASQAGLGWLDIVQADLEGANYASGAVDLCAAGLGAPHIRQRLYWVANAHREPGGQGREVAGGIIARGDAQPRSRSGRDGGADILADASGSGLPVCEPAELRGSGRRREGRAAEQLGGASGGMADAQERDQRRHAGDAREAADESGCETRAADGDADRGAGGMVCDGPASPTNGFWRDADWLLCRDDKWRPVEPGTFPLAHGAPARVGRLRGYGNAIVAPVAQAFIETVMEIIG